MEPPDGFYVQKRHQKPASTNGWDDFGGDYSQPNVPPAANSNQPPQVPSAQAFYGYGERHSEASPYSAGSAFYSAAPNAGYEQPSQPQMAQGNTFYNPTQSFSFSDPMVGAAAAYGQQFAAAYGQQFAQQGKETLAKVVPVAKIKYFFAVDTKYVLKKLLLLTVPFFHRDWSLRYQAKDDPVAPMFDVNAPDLYIPVMAFVTYIFLSGFVLGTQDRFSPEQLGISASSALAWVLFENVVVFLTKYIMNIQQVFGFFETLAFIGYKFVGMIVTLIVYLIGGRTAYYYSLGYCALAVTFFLVRSVRSAVLPETVGTYEEAKKRKLYLILFISLTQPFIMWWLTSSLAAYHSTPAMSSRRIPNMPIMDDDSLSLEDNIIK